MMQTDSIGQHFEKQKNILDLEHQAQINYFNIISISFITITFTVVWSYLTEKISLQLLMRGLAVSTTIFAVSLALIVSKLKNIKEQIKNL